MMRHEGTAKNRAFTRSEMEKIRRADLQNLYKIHGLKGANQRSEILIDSLVTHFASPSFTALAPLRPASPGGRRLKALGTGVGQEREVKRRSAVGSALALKAKDKGKVVEEVVLRPIGGVERLGTVEIAPTGGHSRPSSPSSGLPSISTKNDINIQLSTLHARISALEARPTTSSNAVPAELAELRRRLETVQLQQSGLVTLSQVKEILAERDSIWETRLRSVEEGWERRLRSVEDSIRSQGSITTPSMSANPSFTTPLHTAMSGRFMSPQKRSNPPSPSNQNTIAGPSAKRPRLEPPLVDDTDEDESRDIEEEDEEPPRTPSPGHQGLRPDYSKSPMVGGSTFFPPPALMQKGETPLNQSIPYPKFATTPRPAITAPLSPTLDAPPSANRARLGGNVHFGPLTPGRKRDKRTTSVPAPRAVSNAHHELSTITEDGVSMHELSSIRRRVASAEPHLGMAMSSIERRDGSITPSRLSPSPSIPDSAFKRPMKSRMPTRLGRNDSPSREYMQVALHGLPQPAEEVKGGGGDGTPSRSAMGMGMGLVTPGHRTLLGTERWRDTRFGDVDVIQWGTPRVDLGPGTPGFGSG